MKSRTAWFSVRLYLDALRQLRIAGVVFGVLTALGSILTAMYYSSQKWSYSGKAPEKQLLTLFSANPVLLILTMLFAVVLPLVLFGYLNSRRACDVVHALPVTRTALFLSQFAAVLTWLAAGIAAASALSLACIAPLSYFELAVPGVLTEALYALEAGLFVAAACALAAAVTGTALSTLVVAALILVTPRLFVWVFVSTLESMLAILTANSLPQILDLQNNPIMYLPSSFDGGAPGLFRMIYVPVVGLLYAGGALAAFRLRRSEDAEKSAPNRVLQAVYRITFTMLICLIPCVIILQSISANSSLAASERIWLVILYVVAAVAYFLYELLTTKRVKNLVRSLPALAIVAALNVCYIGGVMLSRSVILNDLPAAGEVSSMEFRDVRSQKTAYPSYDNSGYSAYASSYYYDISDLSWLRLSSDDAEVIELATQRLALEARWISHGKRGDLQDYFSSSDSSSYSCTAVFNRRGGALRRTLYFSSDEWRKILQNSDIPDSTADLDALLPSLDDLNAVDALTSVGTTVGSGKALEGLYDTLRREAAQRGEKELLSDIVRGMGSSDGLITDENDVRYLPGYLRLEYNPPSSRSRNGLPSYIYLPFSSRYPEAAALFMDKCNRLSDADTVIAALRKGAYSGSMVVQGLDITTEGRETTDVYFSLESEENGASSAQLTEAARLRVAALLEQNGVQPVDITRPLWMIQYDYGNQLLFINADETPLMANEAVDMRTSAVRDTAAKDSGF